MATGHETKLLNKMRDAGKAKYGERLVIIKYHGSQYGEAGVSDLLGCLDGTFFAIEVKAPESYLVKGVPSVEKAIEKGPTLKQLAFLDRVREAGGISAVCASVEGFLETLSRCENLL